MGIATCRRAPFCLAFHRGRRCTMRLTRAMGALRNGAGDRRVCCRQDRDVGRFPLCLSREPILPPNKRHQMARCGTWVFVLREDALLPWGCDSTRTFGRAAPVRPPSIRSKSNAWSICRRKAQHCPGHRSREPLSVQRLTSPTRTPA